MGDGRRLGGGRERKHRSNLLAEVFPKVKIKSSSIYCRPFAFPGPRHAEICKWGWVDSLAPSWGGGFVKLVFDGLGHNKATAYHLVIAPRFFSKL